MSRPWQRPRSFPTGGSRRPPVLPRGMGHSLRVSSRRPTTRDSARPLRLPFREEPRPDIGPSAALATAPVQTNLRHSACHASNQVFHGHPLG